MGEKCFKCIFSENDGCIKESKMSKYDDGIALRSGNLGVCSSRQSILLQIQTLFELSSRIPLSKQSILAAQRNTLFYRSTLLRDETGSRKFHRFSR